MRRYRGSAVARWRPGGLPFPSLCCSLPSVGFAPFGGGLCRFRPPWGSTLVPRNAATALRALGGWRGFGARRSCRCPRIPAFAGAAAFLLRACFARLLARVCRGCVCRFRVGCPGFSPLSPPPLRPRWGLRGARCPFGWGFAPPRECCASRSPLAAPPARCARPRCADPGPVHNPKIVNRVSYTNCVRPPAGFPIVRSASRSSPSGVPVRFGTDTILTRSGREICPAGLTFPARCGTLVFRCPFRSFGGCPSRGIQGRLKPLDRKIGRLFLSLRLTSPALPKINPSTARPLPYLSLILDRQIRRAQQNLCHFVAFTWFK